MQVKKKSSDDQMNFISSMSVHVTSGKMLSDLNQAALIVISQTTKIKRVSRIHPTTNLIAIVSLRLRGDSVPLGSSPTKSV